MGDFRITAAFRLYLVLLCTMVGAALSTGTGKCPVYPSLPDFDVQRMSGVWYEVERSFYLMELATSCTALNVSVSDRGHMLISVNTLNRWTGAESWTQGVGVPKSAGASQFRFKPLRRLPPALARLLPGAGLYHVLFTDYEQFALIWACSSVSIAHSDRMWVLARQRDLPASVRAQVYAIMEDLHLDPDRLILAKNHNCSN